MYTYIRLCLGLVVWGLGLAVLLRFGAFFAAPSSFAPFALVFFAWPRFSLLSGFGVSVFFLSFLSFFGLSVPFLCASAFLSLLLRLLSFFRLAAPLSCPGSFFLFSSLFFFFLRPSFSFLSCAPFSPFSFRAFSPVSRALLSSRPFFRIFSPGAFPFATISRPKIFFRATFPLFVPIIFLHAY